MTFLNLNNTERTILEMGFVVVVKYGNKLLATCAIVV